MADLPQILSSWTSPSYKRADVTAAGGPKILSNLTPISKSTPYVAINHPLLTSILQEIGNLANSLAVQAIEVVFFKHAHSCAGPQNRMLSQKERIQCPHSSAM